MKYFHYVNVTKLNNAKSKMQISHKTKRSTQITKIWHLYYTWFVVTESICSVIVGY